MAIFYVLIFIVLIVVVIFVVIAFIIVVFVVIFPTSAYFSASSKSNTSVSFPDRIIQALSSILPAINSQTVNDQYKRYSDIICSKYSVRYLRLSSGLFIQVYSYLYIKLSCNKYFIMEIGISSLGCYFL